MTANASREIRGPPISPKGRNLLAADLEAPYACAFTNREPGCTIHGDRPGWGNSGVQWEAGLPSRAGHFPGRKEAKTEVVAGLTTFFTMSYIVVVNPSVLATSGTGMPFSGVLTATVLLSFFATLLMGLYARVPFAVAPGLGLNAFFAYTIVLGSDVPWPTALGMVFWAGLLFVLLSLSSIRVAIVDAIPPALRTATAVGIGLLLTFIGFRNAGLVVSDQSTFLKLGDLGPQTLLSLLGLLIMIWMMRRKNPLSFIAGIFVVTAMAGCSVT